MYLLRLQLYHLFLFLLNNLIVVPVAIALTVTLDIVTLPEA